MGTGHIPPSGTPCPPEPEFDIGVIHLCHGTRRGHSHPPPSSRRCLGLTLAGPARCPGPGGVAIRLRGSPGHPRGWVSAPQCHQPRRVWHSQPAPTCRRRSRAGEGDAEQRWGAAGQGVSCPLGACPAVRSVHVMAGARVATEPCPMARGKVNSCRAVIMRRVGGRPGSCARVLPQQEPSATKPSSAFPISHSGLTFQQLPLRAGFTSSLRGAGAAVQLGTGSAVQQDRHGAAWHGTAALVRLGTGSTGQHG